MFKKLFGKEKKASSPEVEKEASKYEERQPNHWAFDDDPLLNMEPVFTDDPLAPKDPLGLANAQNIRTPEEEQKLKEIRNNVKQSNKSVEGNSPLGQILNSARSRSHDLQEEVIANDPVIAKLHRIEELQRSGGTDASLYTDLSKSKQGTYAKRAAEFNEINGLNKKTESRLERAQRLKAEAEERAQFARENSGSANEMSDRVNTFRSNNMYAAQSVRKAPQASDNDLAANINRFKTSNNHFIEVDTKKTQPQGIFENINSYRQQNMQHYSPRRINNNQYFEEVEDKTTVKLNKQIEELNAKIQEKLNKLERHKEALARREARIELLEIEATKLMEAKELEQSLLEEEKALEARTKALAKKEQKLTKTIKNNKNNKTAKDSEKEDE